MVTSEVVLPIYLDVLCKGWIFRWINRIAFLFIHFNIRNIYIVENDRT